MAISGALAADTDGELSVTRDPTRIDPILDKIRDLWKRHPDLRLGQLIFLLAGGKDLWSIEDEQLVAGIKRVKITAANDDRPRS